MSQLFVDDVVSKEGTQSVGFSKGVNVSASSTITGNLNVSGVLTYEDVTNVDSVGIVTARGGIKIGAAGIGGTIAANGNTTLAGIVTCDRITAQGGVEFGVAGVGGTISQVGNAIISGITTVGTALSFADNVHAKFGAGGDLEIFHDGSSSRINNATGSLKFKTATKYEFYNSDGSENLAVKC